jgi:hypothetical protein
MLGERGIDFHALSAQENATVKHPTSGFEASSKKQSGVPDFPGSHNLNRDTGLRPMLSGISGWLARLERLPSFVGADRAANFWIGGSFSACGGAAGFEGK